MANPTPANASSPTRADRMYGLGPMLTPPRSSALPWRGSSPAHGPASPQAIIVPKVEKDLKLPRRELSSVDCPLAVTVEGSVRIKGTIKLERDSGAPYQVNVAPGATEVERRLEGAFRDFTLKGGYDAEKGGKITLRWTTAGFPFTFELSAHADITKILSFTIKPRQALTLCRVPLGPGLVFEGTLEPRLHLNFGPNWKWRGFAAWFRAAIRWGWPRLVDLGHAAKTVFVADELGAVTIVGAVAAGVAVGALCVTAIGGGLYLIGKAHRDGQREGILKSFAAGYADALTDLTSDRPQLKPAAARDLLTVDVPGQLRMMGALPGLNVWLLMQAQDQAYGVGKAAAVQAVHQAVRQGGDQAWRAIRARLRAVYGASNDQRRHYLVWALIGQVQSRADRIGIPMV